MGHHGRTGLSAGDFWELCMNRAMKAAWGSLGVSLAALGLKLSARWVTRSVALYSGAHVEPESKAKHRGVVVL
jgi:hypothetical protein